MDQTEKKSPVISFASRHSAGIYLSLSRYRQQWFVTYSRPYGMIAPTRIKTKLNNPHASVQPDVGADISKSRGKMTFWLNPDTYPSNASSYNPTEPDYENQRYLSSIIHELLDGEPSVVRLTGRKRKEISQYYEDRDTKKEVECVELEVIIPESGLLRQCYYCFAWEYGGQDDERFKQCGGGPGQEDVFWCSSCESRGVVATTVTETFNWIKRDKILPMINRHVQVRDSLYS